MFKCQKQNYHYSKLPILGDIGYLVKGQNRFGDNQYLTGQKQKYQVMAYPLCDNVLPYSKGIHTAFFKSLKNGRVIQASGFYFDSLTV